ncbi:MAG TPA: ABC transporter ATP-binding protein [Patescibacteria group bacterium]|nr:ABC transporter ATP-binding protein [Patescibacteria group bacterium]
MIRVVNLKKEFVMGEVHVHALRGVSFEIQDGEFIAIMGKSGSGKSTLLRQLGLIDEPTEGEIYYDDKGTHELSEKERSHFRLTYLGYIFQEFALIPELTAMENVMLPAMMQGAQKEEYESRAKKLLETVGLGDRVHHRPRQLSGGQQQRVAIARSLINAPKVLFADEPTASLDSVSSTVVMETFAKLNKEMHQTIVLVTHDQEDEKYIDRTIWVKDGQLTHKHGKK